MDPKTRACAHHWVAVLRKHTRQYEVRVHSMRGTRNIHDTEGAVFRERTHPDMVAIDRASSDADLPIEALWVDATPAEFLSPNGAPLRPTGYTLHAWPVDDAQCAMFDHELRYLIGWCVERIEPMRARVGGRSARVACAVFRKTPERINTEFRMLRGDDRQRRMSQVLYGHLPRIPTACAEWIATRIILPRSRQCAFDLYWVLGCTGGRTAAMPRIAWAAPGFEHDEAYAVSETPIEVRDEAVAPAAHLTGCIWPESFLELAYLDLELIHRVGFCIDYRGRSEAGVRHMHLAKTPGRLEAEHRRANPRRALRVAAHLVRACVRLRRGARRPVHVTL